MIDLTLQVSLRQNEFTLEVSDRSHVQVLGLFGPSGAGKTTLLEAVAGLRRIERGEIRLADRLLFSSSASVNLLPRERRVGYVPQDALLFPHLRVRANLMYGARGVATKASLKTRLYEESPPQRVVDVSRVARVSDGGGSSDPPAHIVDLSLVAEMLEITDLLDRRVQGLSGGERQRVAIGRALMTQPTLLLLDEPLAGVDRARRERILPYLLRIRSELHVPLVYVTHDVEELHQIADRVLVIEEGRLVRAGAPADVIW